MKNNSLFNPESMIWQPFGRIADYLILSCLWLLCSIPVLTAGAATAAMYDCCARCIKGGERELFSRFFRTFRRELVQGAGGLLLWAGILGGLYFLIRGFTGSAEPGTLNLVLSYAMAMLLVFVLGTAAWVFPLQSRFTFRFGDLQLTAFRLAVSHLPRTMGLGLVNLAAGLLCLKFVMPVMVVPGISSLVSAHILEPVFKTYENREDT